MPRQHIGVIRDYANYFCISVYTMTKANDKVLYLFVDSLESEESIHSPNIALPH